MIRSMLAEVGMRMYTASKLGCASRLLVMDSMTGCWVFRQVGQG